MDLQIQRVVTQKKQAARLLLLILFLTVPFSFLPIPFLKEQPKLIESRASLSLRSNLLNQQQVLRYTNPAALQPGLFSPYDLQSRICHYTKLQRKRKPILVYCGLNGRIVSRTSTGTLKNSQSFFVWGRTLTMNEDNMGGNISSNFRHPQTVHNLCLALLFKAPVTMRERLKDISRLTQNSCLNQPD